MPDTKQHAPSLTPTDEDAIGKLRAEITSGINWYIALLGAVQHWQSSVETFKGQTYRYLIAGEALDFMLLAQRLLEAIEDLVPEDEQLAFLFRNKQPVVLTTAQFKEHLGDTRYKQYLNYFYGITAEEALIQALEDEVHKEEHGLQLHSDQEQTEEAYHRIYDQSRKELLREFRRLKGCPQTTAIELSQMKEFYYWLFQKRLQMHEKAKTASDTKKALDWLKKNSNVDLL